MKTKKSWDFWHPCGSNYFVALTPDYNTGVCLSPLQTMSLHELRGHGKMLDKQVQGRVSNNMTFINQETFIFRLCGFCR